MVGEKIGPFEILKELGSGAMGTVYKALYVDEKTGKERIVALKMIGMGLLGNETALKRFEREAEILKQLRHPNIVRLFATGSYRKTPFFAMEFIEGQSMDRLLERRKRFPWEEVVHIGKQLCMALQHAHEKGIIHRDLKPSNLMLLPDGTLKLTDFGIAKDTDVTALTGANSTVGTAAYMSPEQCRGERNLTAKSDLYSLGIVFYELLTGRKPFVAESAVDMFLLHVNGTFERPSRLVMDIPIWLDTLVCQLMEKRPELRPRDAAMVAQVLDEIREKVETQNSVGAQLVNAKVGDGMRLTAAPDDEDREVARALKAGKKRKKLKDKSVPVYQRPWFGISAAAVLLVLIGVTLWQLTKAPSPSEMLKAIEAAQGDAKIEAIERYLKVYGSRNDETTQRVKEIDREIKVNKREEQLVKRYVNKMIRPVDEDDPEATRLTFEDAFELERAGDLVRAKEAWQKVAERLENNPHSENTLWAGVAKKRIRSIDEAHKREERLLKLYRDLLVELEPKFAHDSEKDLLEAYRYEKLGLEVVGEGNCGDLARARDRYASLRDKWAKDPNEQLPYLFAARKVRQLKEQTGGDTPNREKELARRRDLIQQMMNAAEPLRTQDTPQSKRAARVLYKEVADLYKGDTDKDIEKTAEVAQNRWKALAP